MFLIEDDGVLPPDALSRLLADFLAHPYAGFIEGVELGRWDLPYVGAWRTDDVYDMERLESVMPERPELLNDAGRAIGAVADKVVEEIDAGGFYACLTRYRQYSDHMFRPWDGCVFGPDIEWGIALRQQGYRNYLDWSVAVDHCRPDGTSVHPRSIKPAEMAFLRKGERWVGSSSTR